MREATPESDSAQRQSLPVHDGDCVRETLSLAPPGEKIADVRGMPAFGWRKPTCDRTRSVGKEIRHGVGQVAQERFVGIALVFQIVDRLVGIHANQTTHVPSAPNAGVVLVNVPCAEVVGAQRAEVFVEALSAGHPFEDRLAVGNVPFADPGCLIAALPHPFRKGDLAAGIPRPRLRMG